jgi:hypothetical protein
LLNNSSNALEGETSSIEVEPSFSFLLEKDISFSFSLLSDPIATLSGTLFLPHLFSAPLVPALEASFCFPSLYSILAFTLSDVI